MKRRIHYVDAMQNLIKSLLVLNLFIFSAAGVASEQVLPPDSAVSRPDPDLDPQEAIELDDRRYEEERDHRDVNSNDGQSNEAQNEKLPADGVDAFNERYNQQADARREPRLPDHVQPMKKPIPLKREGGGAQPGQNQRNWDPTRAD